MNNVRDLAFIELYAQEKEKNPSLNMEQFRKELKERVGKRVKAAHAQKKEGK